jgi:hypothetical protein
MSSSSTPSTSAQVAQDDIEVGSFSLETLTTGMYENPFHCIREYVQNGFDAIRDAIREGLLKEEGSRVTIGIGGTPTRPSLSVRDNGVGISIPRAVTTLVSLGASRKTPAQHAGFRGIGRLAGVAYSTTLRFTTKAVGEEMATIVEFDCGRLRGYMKPGAEPQDVRHVVRTSATWRTIPEQIADHFTEVEMVGLTGLGLEFVELEKLLPYLRQVCPVEYSDRFSFAGRIRSLAASFGEAIPFVELEARQKKERTQILKPYQDSSPVGGPKKNLASKLVDIETIVSKELGWYGWVGVSNFLGEITDDTVAGVRFRVKNIQIGDSDLIEEIAEELTPSGTDRRLQRYAVGEIFVTNTQVVPNARRDGFEDNSAWRAIRKDVRTRIAKRVVTLVRAASDSRGVIKRVKAKADELRRSVAISKITQAAAARTDGDLKRQLSLLETDKLTGADPKEVSALVSDLKGLQERLAKIPVESPPPPPPPPQISEPTTAVPSEPPKSLMDIVREVLTEEFGEDEAERLVTLINERAEEALDG